MAAKGHKNLYLKEATLSGYRSIRKDVKVKFKPGLNIIIGKNAVGKTNFMGFLSKVLDFDFEGLYLFQSVLHFQNDCSYEVSAGRTLDQAEKGLMPKINKTPITFAAKVDSVALNLKDETDPKGFMVNKDLVFRKSFIGHGIPQSGLYLLSDPCSIHLDSEGLYGDVYRYCLDTSVPYVLRSIIYELISECYTMLPSEDRFNSGQVRERVAHQLRAVMPQLSDILKGRSPIEMVRLSDNLNVFNTDKGHRIDNLFFEFLIDGLWLPYKDLSDGTRRLVLILLETAFRSRFIFETVAVRSQGSTPGIVLIEEPELGIHPHELHNLMGFLKEQAKDLQIIITTHSPQVLNVLGPRELNRIIVASNSSKRGTRFRNLNRTQIAKAKKYMEEELFLSDYWMHSDLED